MPTSYSESSSAFTVRKNLKAQVWGWPQSIASCKNMVAEFGRKLKSTMGQHFISHSAARKPRDHEAMRPRQEPNYEFDSSRCLVSGRRQPGRRGTYLPHLVSRKKAPTDWM